MAKRTGILCLLLLLAGLGAQAQSPTPNLHLVLPAHEASNWDTTFNNDLTLIDTAVGALQASYQGAWISTTSYSTGQTVLYNNIYYQSLTAGNVGNTPPSSSLAWRVFLSLSMLGGNSGGTMAYPTASGITVYNGVGWGTSLAAPAGAIVGTTDTQSLSNKTVDGVSPTVFSYLDAASSIQTQLNGKQPLLGFTPVSNALTINGHSLSGNFSLGFADLALGAIANGTTATTQAYGDSSNRVSTDAFVAAAIATAGGGMVYPSATGIAVFNGTHWGTSLAAPLSALVGTSDTQALTNKSIDGSEITTGTLNHARLPALLSADVPNNQANTVGSAGSLSGASLLPNGTTAATQAITDTTTKVATNQYVALYVTNAIAGLSGGGGGGGGMVYPTTSGIAVYNGVGWTTSLTAPSSAIVGLTDTQSLTNKTIDGVTPATLFFLDATSSVQTQLNGKQANLGFTPMANIMTQLGDFIAGGASGSPIRIAAAAGTTGVPETLCETPGAAASFCMPGIGGRTVTAATDTVAATDRNNVITYNSASAVSVTLNSAASIGSNFDFALINVGAGTVTLTPGAGTITYGTTTGAGSVAVASGMSCTFNSPDNTNYIARCSPSSAGSGGSGGSTITVNGGGGLGSPTNLASSSGAGEVDVSNPSGATVSFLLHYTTIGVAGTVNEINSSTANPALGGATTLSLATPIRTRQCEIVWGGSGTGSALQSGDDALTNNSCFNETGVTQTVIAVYCKSDSAGNATTVNPTFGASGTGTNILGSALTCGSSNTYAGTTTIANGILTSGSGVDPVMGGSLTGTSIHLLLVYMTP